MNQPLPYVTCERFCGAKITDYGRDPHNAECGISDDEIAQLDKELKAKRVLHAVEIASGTAPAGAEVPPVEPNDESESEGLHEPEHEIASRFRCSCGDSFLSWEGLGDHHAESGHVGVWQEPGETTGTVDSQPAKIVHDPPPSLPITQEPITLAKALKNLDEARAQHGKTTLALTAAKSAEKSAQAVVDGCIEVLFEAARREAQPELPLGGN